MISKIHIDDLAQAINETCHEKGFWPELPPEAQSFLFGTKLALIHSEVSEALEELRKGNYQYIAEELADIIIRVLDLSYEMGYHNMQRIINLKMTANSLRPVKHGKKF